MNRNTFFVLFLLISNLVSGQDLKLWYSQPAQNWSEALPIGNSRLGAMVYGGIEREELQLNEETFWAGSPYNNNNPNAVHVLPIVRKLIFEGRNKEAQRLIDTNFLTQQHGMSYLTLGSLYLEFPEHQNASGFYRDLNLENATTTTRYQVDDVTYTRTTFASFTDNVIIMHIKASKANALNFTIAYNCPLVHKVNVQNDQLTVTCQGKEQEGLKAALRAECQIQVKTNGTLRPAGNTLQINEGTEATLYISAATNYVNYQDVSADESHRTSEYLKRAMQIPYEKALKSHIAYYKKQFDRVRLTLPTGKASQLETPKRIENFGNGEDMAMAALLFHYGRYLLISSSRENSPLPANLQGVWNDNLACNMSWSCDYHLDINTEQNYWASNVTNLHECNQPFFNYIESLSEDGEKTARRVYGSPGWVAHTVTNVWGNTAPGGGVNWGLFPVASCWVASHLWSHYCYTQDQEFLKNQAYPILKKNAIFFLDYMTTDPNTGYLVTGPTNSAENSFKFNGWELALSMMPTCDRVLVHELYTSCIEASKILNTDTGFRDSLQQALAKFPPLKIGKNGEVQEWMEDFEQAHPNHRHASHLLALYPFAQISVAHTPELAQAAKKAIDNKLAAPDWEDVEFSRANMINFYARLKEPEEAYNSVCYLLQKLTRENLLTVSPKGIAGAPWDIFIFDGNQAGISGIAEMLVQNHEGYIEFLPALPQAWPTGSYKGLCVKGGAETDLKWQNGKVTAATVKATTANTFRLKLPAGTSNPKSTLNGKTYTLSPDNEGIITLELSQGDCFELKY